MHTSQYRKVSNFETIPLRSETLRYLIFDEIIPNLILGMSVSTPRTKDAY